MQLNDRLDKYYPTLSICIRCKGCSYGDWPDFPEICPPYKSRKFFTYCAGGIAYIARGLLEGRIGYDRLNLEPIYKCTTCGACDEYCAVLPKRPPPTLSPLDMIVLLRAELVRRGIGPLPEHKRFCTDVRTEHNPYNGNHGDRLTKATMDLGRLLPKKGETLYYVGCTTAYRAPELARATINVIRRTGVDPAVLADEWCCGSPLYSVGDWEILEELAKHNMSKVREAGVKRIIFSCPGCYRMFRKYAEFLPKEKMNFELLHMVEYVSQLVEKDKLKFKETKRNITYHDPCHLGRSLKIYEEPRKVLNSIPKLQLVEMKRIKRDSYCCGSGGGVKAAYDDFAAEVADERLCEATETSAGTMTTACPFCFIAFKESSRRKNAHLKIHDISQILTNVVA